MAGIRSRISTLFKTKMNTPLAVVENPKEAFDLL
jgi:hypothetical protein